MKNVRYLKLPILRVQKHWQGSVQIDMQNRSVIWPLSPRRPKTHTIIIKRLSSATTLLHGIWRATATKCSNGDPAESLRYFQTHTVATVSPSVPWVTDRSQVTSRPAPAERSRKRTRKEQLRVTVTGSGSGNFI